MVYSARTRSGLGRGARLLAVAAVFASLLTGMLASARPAFGAGTFAIAPFTYTADPVTAGGAVIIERVAPRAAGLLPTWRMNLDLLAKNTSSSTQTLTGIDITYPGSTIPSLGATIIPKTVGGGKSGWVLVPESRLLPFPLPATVKVTLHWTGFDPQSVTYPLYLRKNNTPTGGYRFPAFLKTAGQYWSTRGTQDIGSGHRAFRPQKYAYDLGISRWNGTAWVETRSAAVDLDPNTVTSTDFLVFGVPLYAMHDGTIIECRTNFADNKPASGATPAQINGYAGGNSLWIDFGNGETALYAHLKAGTIPAGLCPTQSKTSQENGGGAIVHAQPIKVKEGQFLGNAGNSGATGGTPHLHLHVQDKHPLDWIDGNDGAGAQALPILFDHLKVRGLNSSMAGYDPSDAAAAGFASVTQSSPAAMPSFSLNNPNGCGWKPVLAGLPQVERHAVSASCFGEILGDATIKGYRPTFFDVYDVNGPTYTNMIFRPAGGVAWKAYAGLTGATLQSTYDSLVAAGYRLIQVESFLQNGAPRYDAIFAKQAGPAVAMYHGLDQFQEKDKAYALTAAGYHPINMSVISVNGERQWTALWIKEQVSGWAASVLTPDSMFASDMQNLHNAGNVTPIYLNAYVHDGGVYFCIITVTGETSDWAALSGLSSTNLTSAAASQLTAGRLMAAVAGYNKGGVATFAGAWLGQ